MKRTHAIAGNTACDQGRRRALAAGSGALLLGGLAHGTASAQTSTIPATSTALVSGSDRMISYRFQNRMWQTPDGGTHLVINRGPLAPDSALTLFSSFDNGLTWAGAIALPQSNLLSTVDGILVNNSLGIVYSTSSGQIRFAVLAYDSATKTWTRKRLDTVFAQTGFIASSPAFVVDNSGAMWCCVTVQDQATLIYALRMFYRPANGNLPWRDTGLSFGRTDSLSSMRAGRPLLLPSGVGLIYTDEEAIAWATRVDGAPVNSTWADSVFFTSVAGSQARGEFGGHFSVVADTQGNLHLATVDELRIVYFCYLLASQQWSAIRYLSTPVAAVYVQVTECEGNIVVIGNSAEQAQVIQSSDLGTTFAKTHFLTHPASSGTVDYHNARLESPAVSRNPIPVLQQYTDGALQRLMYFAVPIAN